MANYTDYVTALANTIVMDADDPAFVAILPTCINYAEDRLARELDLVAANVRDSTASTTTLNRNFNLPTGIGTFLVIDGINVITPASTAPESGTRRPLIPTSRAFLDSAWPSTTGATVPQYFAWITQDTFSSPTQSQIIFGPWPDAAYRIEVIGKIQPAPLSPTNTTTWISVNLFDLFFAASMVFMTGWQQNFAAGTSDNAPMSTNWENTYKTLLASAATYQARARFAGASWTSAPIEPIAQPQRG